MLVMLLFAVGCGSDDETVNPNDDASEPKSRVPVVGGGGGLATVTASPGLFAEPSFGLPWPDVKISPDGGFVVGSSGAYGPGGLVDAATGFGPFFPYGDAVAPYGYGMTMQSVNSNAIAVGSGLTMTDIKPLVFDVTRNQIQSLPTLPGAFMDVNGIVPYQSGVARDINATGTIVGYLFTHRNPSNPVIAAMWTPNGLGSYTVSTSPSGQTESWATAVNDAGAYVVNRVRSLRNFDYYAYVAYPLGTYEYLYIPTLSYNDSFFATDINNRRDVAGYVWRYWGGVEQAFVRTGIPISFYDINAVCAHDLGSRCGRSRANAVNDGGIVVGEYGATGSIREDSRGFAFVPILGSTSGSFYDLTSMIPTGSPVTRIISAIDIDAEGRIVAIGTGPGGRRVVLLSNLPLY